MTTETQTKTEAYTVAELLALPVDKLNALAAEIMPSNQIHSADHLPLYGKYRPGKPRRWVKWTPATDRNQSAALLEWFASRRFSVSIHRDQCGETSVGITHSDYGAVGAHHGEWAMAETVAAIAMWLKIKGRLGDA